MPNKKGIPKKFLIHFKDGLQKIKGKGILATEKNFNSRINGGFNFLTLLKSGGIQIPRGHQPYICHFRL